MKMLAVVCTWMMLSCPCIARTITVDDDGPADFDTIQAAIDYSVDGDEIVVADGRYARQGNGNIDFGGRAITVRSKSGPESCIIDLERLACGFDFHNGESESSIVRGFSITYGWAFNGGAIYCHNSSPTIANCIISDSVAGGPGGGAGGAIYCAGASPTIVDCTISNNVAAGPGGGIFCTGESNPKIINCTIINNSVESYIDGVFGGGVGCEQDSNANIINCIISGNRAIGRLHKGGGIGCIDSSPVITNCTIYRNWSIYGSGLYFERGNPVITRCMVTRNEGPRAYGRLYTFGGGMHCRESNPKITNSTLSGNYAGSGGGICCEEASTATVNNCTVTGNSADFGGGIFSQDSNCVVTNCVLWANEAAWEGPEIFLADYGNVWAIYSGIEGSWPGEGNIDADPCFVDRGFWEDANDPNAIWVDGDYRLWEDSPCIDAGDPNYMTEPNETDLDGNPRVISSRIDMGAYEYWPPVQAEMKLTPQSVNCASRGKYIKAHITLPEPIFAEDVDVNEPALAEPVDVESEYIKILGNGDSPVKVEIGFDRQEFCDCVAETGQMEVTVRGYLTTGQAFIATDTVKIGKRGGRR